MYGYICARCNLRFGLPQKSGWIDIVHSCKHCQSILKSGLQIDEEIVDDDN